MRIYLDDNHFISISEGNSKMGKVPSFSLLPGITCAKGVPCYKDCYARKMCTRRDSTALAYQGNTMAVKDCWGMDIVDVLVGYIKMKRVRFFRFNVSGDFGIPGYWDIAVEVAKQCPETKFMAFTKCYWVQEYKRPRNFNLILSAWHDYQPENPKAGIAYFDDGTYPIPKKAVPCSGRCDECFKCYDLRKGQAVVFKKH